MSSHSGKHIIFWQKNQIALAFLIYYFDMGKIDAVACYRGEEDGRWRRKPIRRSTGKEGAGKLGKPREQRRGSANDHRIFKNELVMKLN